MHVLGKVLHQAGGQDAEVARGRGVAGLGQALGVTVAGRLHAQRLRLVVHQLDEPLDRAADTFSQRHRGVVAGLHDHALDQIVDWHRHLRVDEHGGAADFPGPHADRQALLEVDLFRLQRIEYEVLRHQLGQRRRFHRSVDVARRQHLVGSDIEQQIAAGCDFGRLRRLRRRGKAQKAQEGRE